MKIFMQLFRKYLVIQLIYGKGIQNNLLTHEFYYSKIYEPKFVRNRGTCAYSIFMYTDISLWMHTIFRIKDMNILKKTNCNLELNEM